MIASERKLFILRALREQGVINLKTVAQELGISETTVRRDFEKMEQEGRLHRVQGGAMLNDSVDVMVDGAESSMRSKKNLNREEKLRVAHCAAQYVQEGDSVFLDVGTSILPLGEILMKRKVHIVTNNTMLLNLPGSTVADVFIVGGQYNSHYNLLCGPLAQKMISEFHFDHAFIGCFGLSIEKGKTYTLDVDSASIKEAGIRHARHAHLLADRSKIDRTGFYAFADLDAFEHVFFDDFKKGAEMPDNFVLAQK